MERPSEQLRQGMYVRVPVEEERTDHAYRDYRIGRLSGINELAGVATIALYTYAPYQAPYLATIERPLDDIERCRILPDTVCTHLPTGREGRVLLACDDTAPPDAWRDYYVDIDGSTERVGEGDLLVGSHRMDPNPASQLRTYELQHPKWRFLRNSLIESYGQLHNATFGLEDLVGSRVMLLAHQAETIATVLASADCRFILADEVGLGKTIEACVILKGLRRRDSTLRTLVIAPASLAQQWQNELSDKFWLTFPLAIRPAVVYSAADTGTAPGVVVSAEDLAADDDLWAAVSGQHWDLLVVDEAHHLRKDPTLYDRVRRLSSAAPRALILSATPIQRRSDEYLALLAVMDPRRYDALDGPAFQQILAAQERVRSAVLVLSKNVAAGQFDRDDFVDRLRRLTALLPHDQVLADLADGVGVASTSRAIAAARDVLAYVSENYRIENRVIRNRRAHLDVALPERTLDTTYSYEPGAEEAEALDALFDYIASYLDVVSTSALALEYSRILMYAAASSPHALLAALEYRAAHAPPSGHDLADREANRSLLTPAAPRQEAARIRRLLASAPAFDDERERVADVASLVRRWRDATDCALADAATGSLHPDAPHRLVQILRAIYEAVSARSAAKALVFAGWPETLDALRPHLLAKYRGKPQAVVEFRSGLDAGRLQAAADAFQKDPHCRVMVCDELGGEGRNFQIADRIIHVDLPWTPAQLEQRIGRVDRLGRVGPVLSITPFAREWPEHDLFRIWQDAFQLFTTSMSGLEIALEGVQDALVASLTSSVRHGLERLRDTMIDQAAELRETVEEERYFEEGAVNRRQRDEFKQMSDRYRDGKELRGPILDWADLAGLKHSYEPEFETMRFDPRFFSTAAMAAAKFVDPPRMEEARRRSHGAERVITGTFNRDIAVRREDLVFFAPGDDPWTDSIIRNALEADRGRCSAILRTVPGLEKEWRGFEFFYSIGVDPRPLYAVGAAPADLFRAQGFLNVATYRVVLSAQGRLVSQGDRIDKVLRRPWNKASDIHLGQRDDDVEDETCAQLANFMNIYPPEQWGTLLDDVLPVAEQALAEEFDFMPNVAEEATEEFARRARGWRAARRWLLGAYDGASGADEIDRYEHVSEALVAGIRTPLVRLESVCFWALRPGR